MSHAKLVKLCLLLSSVIVGAGSSDVLAEPVDVTFSVPVRLDNIRANWSKVAVMCKGYQQTNVENSHADEPVDLSEVGIIDVSGKARESLNQTVRGTIQVDDNADRWVCYLFIQHRGEMAPTYPRSKTEMKSTSIMSVSGTF